MKLNKIFAVMLAVVAFAFMACNKNSEDVIKLKIKQMNLAVGESYKIPVEKASGAITWASSAEAVATVDAEGTVKAIAEGQAAITATVGSAKATVDVTVGGATPGGGAPDLDAPENGKLKVVIEIPAGSECHGIALKGTFDGSAWSGENTYLGEEGAATPVDGAIYKFAAVPDYANWFVVELPASEAMEFKVCLIYAGDGSWQGQAEGVALHSCNFSNIEPTIDGGQVKNIGANGGLLYLSMTNWQNSECETKVEHDYNVTVKVPTCADSTPEIIGDFDSWAGTALTKDGDVWKATIHAWEGCKIKVREAGNTDWTNQIQYWDPGDPENDVPGEWKDCGDERLGSDLNFEFDFSDPAKYKWTVCQTNE